MQHNLRIFSQWIKVLRSQIGAQNQFPLDARLDTDSPNYWINSNRAAWSTDRCCCQGVQGSLHGVYRLLQLWVFHFYWCLIVCLYVAHGACCSWVFILDCWYNLIQSVTIVWRYMMWNLLCSLQCSWCSSLTMSIITSNFAMPHTTISYKCKVQNYDPKFKSIH